MIANKKICLVVLIFCCLFPSCGMAGNEQRCLIRKLLMKNDTKIYNAIFLLLKKNKESFSLLSRDTDNKIASTTKNLWIQLKIPFQNRHLIFYYSLSKYTWIFFHFSLIKLFSLWTCKYLKFYSSFPKKINS